jgi:hypothetical protein
MEQIVKNTKIAVFFDCENISGSHVTSIFAELAKYGELIVKQSFKDWSSSNNNKSWNGNSCHYEHKGCLVDFP